MSRMQWLKKHPVALMNLIFICLLVSLFFYQLLRPLDVLKDWSVRLSPVKEYKVIDGRRLAVYHPNDSLLFISTSTKVAEASGSTSRTLVCEATDTQSEREIQLDMLPATRGKGYSSERENAITIPDVLQFGGLPRICFLNMDITYVKIALWRSHTEHAQTEPFLVDEMKLTPAEIQAQIDELTKRVKELEGQLNTQGASESQPEPPQNSQSVAVSPATPLEDTPAPTVDNPGVVESLLNGVNNTISGVRDSINGILGGL